MNSSFKHSSLWIEPWRDQITEESGHDPRSRYVEQYWLGVIGPTAAWLMRYVAYEFDDSPDGFELPVNDIALQLGISPKAGPRGGLYRTMDRLVMFRLAAEGHASFAVRRRLPPLNNAQLRRLPQHLQRSHSSCYSQPKSAA
ncbi:hypothetical protein [Candidatus Poriferisocius sp.]|uniref:hypothetical protein n=1 Tax=Candidatus Poriferisocius sp. TaxID=3101276 RepID=UPI003B017EBB